MQSVSKISEQILNAYLLAAQKWKKVIYSRSENAFCLSFKHFSNVKKDPVFDNGKNLSYSFH